MSFPSLPRRTFLRQAALAAVAFPMVSRLRVLGANGRLNIAAVGVGGKGWTDVNKVASQNIVGLCDVDSGRLGQAAAKFPSAKKSADWRQLFDTLGNGFDAVTVSTPDHMHFPPAMAAVRLRKHVYCQKPLTHTVWEARQLTEAARKAKVATQMGNQGMGHGPLRREAEIVRAGALGTVREVHLWTDRPGNFWRQGLHRPAPGGNPPNSLAWDLWLGVAPKRPYAPGYHPFAWRGFWDFGTGALGEWRQLEGAHRAVPQHGLGGANALRVERHGGGSHIESHPAVGYRVSSRDLRGCLGAEGVGRDHVER